MMIDIAQPLKFYSTDGLQLRYKQALTGYKNIPTLKVSKTALLPFIIQRERTADTIADYYDEVLITSIIAHNTLSGENTTLTDYLSIKYAIRAVGDVYYDYALYEGNSSIPAGILTNGRYELRIIDEGSNTFFSETFRIYDSESTIKFEYRNDFSFNHLWFPTSDFFYEMEFEGITFGKGEHDEFLSIITDINNHTGKKIQQRKDKTYTASFLADTVIVDALQLMEMTDTIYITNELGVRSQIEVTNIIPEESDSGDHIHVNLDYRIIPNMITRQVHSLTYIGESTGGSPKSSETGVWIGGKKVYIGGKKEKI